MFDKLIDFHPRGNSLLDLAMNQWHEPVAGMRTDIKESDEAYELHIEMPGVARENVDIKLENGRLTVTASTETKRESKADGKAEGKESEADKPRYHLLERHVGKFSRSFRVPAKIGKDDVAAKLADGVLVVKVAKPATERSTIEIS